MFMRYIGGGVGHSKSGAYAPNGSLNNEEHEDGGEGLDDTLEPDLLDDQSEEVGAPDEDDTGEASELDEDDESLPDVNELDLEW